MTVLAQNLGLASRRIRENALQIGSRLLAFIKVKRMRFLQCDSVYEYFLI